MASQVSASITQHLEADALGIVEADLTERVADAMRRASRAYVSTLVEALVAGGYDGLTPASLSLLSRVPDAGAKTIHLARETGRTKQATGKIVAELEVHGYVRRGPDPSDGRAQLVRRTDRGAAALAEGVKVKAELSRRAGTIRPSSSVTMRSASLEDAVVMGDHDRRRPALAAERLEHLDDGPAAFLVERGGGLVGEDDLGVADERPGHRHALLLPARQVAGQVVEPLPSPTRPSMWSAACRYAASSPRPCTSSPSARSAAR
jgi:DNA-binding MarR family transcriptional regulator